jgi:hypothetical protein
MPSLLRHRWRISPSAPRHVYAICRAAADTPPLMFHFHYATPPLPRLLLFAADIAFSLTPRIHYFLPPLSPLPPYFITPYIAIFMMPPRRDMPITLAGHWLSILLLFARHAIYYAISSLHATPLSPPTHSPMPFSPRHFADISPIIFFRAIFIIFHADISFAAFIIDFAL